MRFDAFEVSLQLVRSLRAVLTRLHTRDTSLATQIKRAAASVPLNLNEGRRRTGKDRIHFWKIAAGSADEVRAALRVAEAFGYLELDAIAEPLQFADRVLAMLWRLTR